MNHMWMTCEYRVAGVENERTLASNEHAGQ